MQRPRSLHPIRRPRRAFSAIWMVAALPVLAGFCSLGVDYGRALLVKSELQVAADAAARYAVTGIAAGIATAQSRAVDAANDNLADATPVTLNPATDVEFGTWNPDTRTFTPLAGSARADATALRITARRTAATGNPVPLVFARLIGKPTADVRATAIATISQSTAGGGYGVVGLGWVNMSGSPLIDSYNAAQGPYSSATAGDNGTVVSNAWINLNGSATIRGDARPGKNAAVNRNGSASVSGSTTPQASDVSFPMPTLPASYTNLGNVNLSGNKSLTLTAGNYYASSFNLSGSADLHVTGQVTLYVNGNFGISGSGNVHVLNNLPKNFRVRMISGAGVNLGGNASLFADIYAPQSPVNVSGSGEIFGAIISAGISLSGSADIHYDESLAYGTTGSGTGGASGQISLVR